MSTRGLSPVLLFFILSAGSCVAKADEPCRETPPNVTCTKDGFNKLVARLVETDTSLKLCHIALDATEKARAELQKRLDELLGTPCPPPPPAPKPPAPELGYALTVLGVIASAAAPAISVLPVEAKAVIGAVGAGLAGVGIILVVPQ